VSETLVSFLLVTIEKAVVEGAAVDHGAPAKTNGEYIVVDPLGEQALVTQ
jgi:hypothetical protein